MGISRIRRTCYQLRADIECLPRTPSLCGATRIASDDNTAHEHARQVPRALPIRLLLRSSTNRLTSSMPIALATAPSATTLITVCTQVNPMTHHHPSRKARPDHASLEIAECRATLRGLDQAFSMGQIRADTDSSYK